MSLQLVLYKIPFFHSSFLHSRHWGLVLCHEWQYFFFLVVVLFRSLDSLLWILFLIVCFLSKIVDSPRPSSVIFWIWIIFLKGCFWGVFLYDSQGFSFDKSFFNIWRGTRGEMCVQEGLPLLKMCLCIKDRFFLESCAFVYNRV